MNTDGSYICTDCAKGWKNNGDKDCQDIDECLDNPCFPDVKCVNLPGSFECQDCPTGYNGSGLGSDGCKLIECPEDTFPFLENAEINCSGYSFGDECTARCPLGYQQRISTFTCQKDGKWEGNVFSCQPLPCSDEPSTDVLPSSGNILPTACSGRMECQLGCLPGFYGSSNTILICSKQKWVGNSSVPFECIKCEQGTTYQPDPGQSVCLVVDPPCNENFFESAAPTLTSNRECSSIRQCHQGSEYILQDATPSSDRICETCRACPNEQFRSSGCDGLIDSNCNACTICGNAEYESRTCTAIQNRRCRTCGFNTYFDKDRGRCVDQINCIIGQIEVKAPTPISPRVCTTTRDGSITEGNVTVRLVDIRYTGLPPSFIQNPSSTGIALLSESIRRVFLPARVRVGILHITLFNERRRSTSTEVQYRVEANINYVEQLDSVETETSRLQMLFQQVISDAAESDSGTVRATADQFKEVQPQSFAATQLIITTTEETPADERESSSSG